MAKAYFVAPEGAETVSRNKVYVVNKGIIAVDDPEDAEAFKGQGFQVAPEPVIEQPRQVTQPALVVQPKRK